jgi:hypothetical protein
MPSKVSAPQCDGFEARTLKEDCTDYPQALKGVVESSGSSGGFDSERQRFATLETTMHPAVHFFRISLRKAYFSLSVAVRR